MGSGVGCGKSPGGGSIGGGRIHCELATLVTFARPRMRLGTESGLIEDTRPARRPSLPALEPQLQTSPLSVSASEVMVLLLVRATTSGSIAASPGPRTASYSGAAPPS